MKSGSQWEDQREVVQWEEVQREEGQWEEVQRGGAVGGGAEGRCSGRKLEHSWRIAERHSSVHPGQQTGEHARLKRLTLRRPSFHQGRIRVRVRVRAGARVRVRIKVHAPS